MQLALGEAYRNGMTILESDPEILYGISRFRVAHKVEAPSAVRRAIRQEFDFGKLELLKTGELPSTFPRLPAEITLLKLPSKSLGYMVPSF